MPPLRSHRPPACCVVLADLIGSRTTGAARPAVQRRLKALTARLNAVSGNAVLSAFQVREGDAFRGVLATGDSLVDLLWMLDPAASGLAVRVGIGWGDLVTFTSFPDDVAGPAFRQARLALTAAAQTPTLGPQLRGFVADGRSFDGILGGLNALLTDKRTRWTVKQREVVAALRHGNSQADVARQLGVTPQSISDRLTNVGLESYLCGERTFRDVLGVFDTRAAWQRMGL